MPDNQYVELRQEDVFSYIDGEMKKNRSHQQIGFTQKTKLNFKMVLIVDLIAIGIAIAGFTLVYNIFKAGEYKLVGAEGSIKGLEDVLYKEMQKKASLDLIQKQQELEDAQKRLKHLSGQMDSFKAEQQKMLKEKYAAFQNEMNAKMKEELKHASVKEKEAIRKSYEEDIKKKQQELQEESLKNQAELKSRLESESKALASLSDSREKELKQTKTELDKVSSEYEKKLAEKENSRSKDIADLNMKLEEKQKINAFRDQVYSVFKASIEAYQKKQFNLSKEKLASVITLYDNKPKDIPIPEENKAIDKFFVETINDYLTIKESGATNKAANNIVSLPVNRDEINKNAEALYSAGNNLLKNKSYEAAQGKFQSIILDYPESQYVKAAYESILKIMEIKYSEDKAKEDQNKKAGAVYAEALKEENSQQYDLSKAKYKEVIQKYPRSDYVERSLDAIERVIQNKTPAAVVSAGNSLSDSDSIGRVVDIIGSDISLYLNNGETLAPGSQLMVYRKTGNGSYKYICEAKISEISPVIIKATVVKKVEALRIGDLIFKK